jgi:hypothetical protein
MINWLNLVYNSIWIVALALALAVFGVAYYQSQWRGEKVKVLLNKAKFTMPLNIAGVIFCVGMALIADKWWEILLWVFLIVSFGYQLRGNKY